MTFARLPHHRAVTASALAAVVCSATLVATAAPASATVVTCNGTTVNWAALYPTLTDWIFGQGATVCFGNKGTNEAPANQTQVFCAGNNAGVVTYYDYATKTTASHTFWPDNSYEVVDGKYQNAGAENPDMLKVTKVQINSWSGSAGC